jgi:hypothetical protein
VTPRSLNSSLVGEVCHVAVYWNSLALHVQVVSVFLFGFPHFEDAEFYSLL